MPVAIAGAVLAGVTAGSAITAGALTIGFSAVAFAGSLALSGLSMLLAPKAKKADTSGSYGQIRSSGATQSIRQPVTARELVYGEVRKSGPVLYAGVTDNNKYMHLCVAIASHEIQGVYEILVGDYSIPMDWVDANGDITEGRYKGYINVQIGLGSTDQLANPFMVANIPEWTSEHRIRGIAYFYVRLKNSRDKFPQGAPNVSCWMKGKKVVDTRDSIEKYSANLALLTKDYLTTDLGGRVENDFINTLVTSSSANTCDEYVSVVPFIKNIENIEDDILTLNGDELAYQTGDKVQLSSGTVVGLSALTDYYVIAFQHHTTPRIKLAISQADAFAGVAISLTSGDGALTKISEPRYHGGGIIKTSAEPQQNTVELLACMMGQAVYAGGSWRIYAGEYQTPTVSFNEDDLAGPINAKTYQPKSDRFNRVQGIYTSPLNAGNPSDYPIIKNALYETEDNGIITRTLDQPFTQRAGQAQRVGKVSLERMRQEITFEAPFKLTAFKVQVGDNFYFSYAKWGWTNKIFEIIDWTLANNDGAPVVKMLVRENAPQVYDWNNGEETFVDYAPNTSLSSPFDVSPPTSIAIYPEEITTSSGDFTYQFVIKWDAPLDSFVTTSGRYEVQFKKSTDIDFRPSFFVDGELTQTQVNQVQPGVNYDVRIRAINSLGVRSQWQNHLGFTVDSPSGATIRFDYGLVSGVVTETIDYGSVAEATEQTLDFGEVV